MWQRTLVFFAFVALAVALKPGYRLASARCGRNCVMETEGSNPGYLNTTETYFSQFVDHFSFRLPSGGEEKFQQRVLLFDKYLDKKNPLIFFYCGNEGNVELYANNTGLMWEHAEEFGALLVFAEHRYYGKSLPFGAKAFDHMEYLTSEQALADYAVLITELKKQLGITQAPVIAFGGSYGGMLSSWFRMKYPAVVDGAIAASAPILAFSGMDDKSADADFLSQQFGSRSGPPPPPVPPSPATPYWDSEKYWAVVTRDASAEGGADAECAPLISRVWSEMFAAAKTVEGRHRLSSTFSLCSELKNEEEAIQLAELVKYAFDTMAMGNFPFASSYLTGTSAKLPAFPVRAACAAVVATHREFEAREGNWSLVMAAKAGAAIFTNVTGDACLTLPADVEEDGIWDYQWCTEMLPQETYFSCDGVNDMFWREPFNLSFVIPHCEQKYSVSPRPDWIATVYGGRAALEQTSNIVFSNGLLDPWSAGGVRYNASESVVSIEIPLGAHHLDLMFSTKDDPPCVTRAREFEVEQIAKWVEEARKRKQQ